MTMDGHFILYSGLFLFLIISRTVTAKQLPDVTIEQPGQEQPKLPDVAIEKTGQQDPEPYNPETDLETHILNTGDTEPQLTDLEQPNTEEENPADTAQVSTGTETDTAVGAETEAQDTVIEPMGEEEKRTDVAPDVVNQSEDEIIDPLTELEFQRERTLAGIKNTDQFCELLDVGCEVIKEEVGMPEQDEEKVLVSGGYNAVAFFDACNVRNQTVALPKDPDPEISIWPTCTRALRCGGCCTSEVFSCEPTETKKRFVKVFRTRPPYKGAQRFDFVDVKTVEIIEHVRCDAQCKVKAIHCNPLQYYQARYCRCVCTNQHLRETCTRDQIWDDNECACVCPQRKTTFCPHPSRFSDHLCKCTLMQSVAGEIDLAQLLANLGRDIVAEPNNEITVAPTTTTEPTTTTTPTTTSTTTTIPTTTEDRCAHMTCRHAGWKAYYNKNVKGNCQCRPNFLGGK